MNKERAVAYQRETKSPAFHPVYNLGRHIMNKVALCVCPTRMDNGIHSDHSYFERVTAIPGNMPGAVRDQEVLGVFPLPSHLTICSQELQ